MLRYPRMRRSCPFLLGDASIEREPRRLAVPLEKARPDMSLSTLFYTAPSNHQDQRSCIADIALLRALHEHATRHWAILDTFELIPVKPARKIDEFIFSP